MEKLIAHDTLCQISTLKANSHWHQQDEVIHLTASLIVLGIIFTKTQFVCANLWGKNHAS